MSHPFRPAPPPSGGSVALALIMLIALQFALTVVLVWGAWELLANVFEAIEDPRLLSAEVLSVSGAFFLLSILLRGGSK